MEENLEMFAVEPITNCKHITMELMMNLQNALQQLQQDFVKQACEDCDQKEENWFCLNSKKFYCSRYKNNHMVEHYEKTGHQIAFSLSDASTWCYECDSYITNDQLGLLRARFSAYKFGDAKKLFMDKQKV